nr:alpha/beta hydrolase [Kibdelosporangium sp. MJ126-NF4]CEL23155.1 peptidase [Kibdelosporangium sp. MJ126-NF4]CTQ90293.1 peptidase [Kibdelosporangium sp. MJ126-NF4]
MTRLRSAAVIPAVLSGLLAGATPALADTALTDTAPLNTTGIPAWYAGQTLAWHLCTDAELPTPRPAGTETLECATFRTPRDWDRPYERQDLTIAVSRLKSTGTTTASVLTNPGGPGAPGRAFPADLRNQARLREHQEIIGIDTRGTGKSTNVTCGGATATGADLDGRDRDPRNLNQIVDAVRYSATSCQRASGELGPLVSTFQNIRDLDLLRVLLGRQRINWIGYSAGTWLGAHYAQQFPARTGRFVLDSSTEFTASWQESFAWQPLGFERRWRQDFLPWLARYDAKYHFGTNGEAARQTYETVRYALSRNPIDIDGVKVGPAKLDSVVIGSLKSKAAFPAVADILVQVKALTEAGAPEHSTAAVKDALAKPQRPFELPARTADAPDAMEATLINTLCNDGRWTGNRQSIIRESQDIIDRDQPLIVGLWMGLQVCAFWKGQPRPMPTLNGKGVPPVLIIQSENDPATPIEGTRRAHAAFRNSRLLTVTGEGDHGIYAFGNPAVDKIADDYLVDGIVPDDRSVPGMPLPVPTG